MHADSLSPACMAHYWESNKLLSMALQQSLPLIFRTPFRINDAWHDSNSFIYIGNCCWCISGIRAPVRIHTYTRQLLTPCSFLIIPPSQRARSDELSSNMLYDISSSCFHINKNSPRPSSPFLLLSSHSFLSASARTLPPPPSLLLTLESSFSLSLSLDIISRCKICSSMSESSRERDWCLLTFILHAKRRNSPRLENIATFLLSLHSLCNQFSIKVEWERAREIERSVCAEISWMNC
jgi:hypothetical protein